MLLLGASAGPDQVAHEQCTLTLSSVQDGRELACMSWEHGLLFSAHIEGRRVVLEATEPTHEWPDTATISHGAIRPFAAMPLPDGASVCLSEFYELLKHGIVMQDDGILIDLNPKKKAGARSLPCVLCPVVHWPVLLLLVQSGWTVPGRSPLTLRASSQVFSEHVAKSLKVAADTWPRVAPQVSEFAAAERIGAELLARAVGQCLALDHALYFVAEPRVIWRQHADSSLVLFASAAELCYSMSVPEQDGSCCAEFIAEHEEHGLCNVRVLEGGRHAARYWRFWTRSVLRELRDAALTLWTENQALPRRDGADAFEQERFDNARETLADSRAETEKHFADASVAGSRTYLSQTIFDMSSRTPRFTPAGDVLLHTPEQEALPEALPVSTWGLVLERDGKFLRNGCYAVSVADPLDGGAMLFNMDFATMSRAMLQEGSELWIGIDSSVYSRIMREANAQGTKIMLPVSDELHARLKTDSAVSRQLRAFYVLGGSSSVTAIDRNSVRVIVVVANKSCAPGRKSAADDNAGAASRINVSIGQNDFKMLTVCLPIYAADSSLSVTYHRDPALPFYRYMKEDNTARSRSSA
jgi:hypothetical protein